MADINFLIPVAGYSGFDIDSVVKAMLSGDSIDDVCSAFQLISRVYVGSDESNGFFYDYLYGLIRRYPYFLNNINNLRSENGMTVIAAK